MKKFILPAILSIFLLSTLMASYPNSVASREDIRQIADNWTGNTTGFIDRMREVCYNVTGLQSNEGTKFITGDSVSSQCYGISHDPKQTTLQCGKLQYLYDSLGRRTGYRLSVLWQVKGLDTTTEVFNLPLKYNHLWYQWYYNKCVQLNSNSIFYSFYNTQGLEFLL